MTVSKTGVRLFAAVAAAAFAGVAPAFEARVTDPLEWLYVDSDVRDFEAFAGTEVPANGVAEANVLFAGLEPGAEVRLGADCDGAEWFRLVDVPVAVNTGAEGGVERASQTNRFVTRDAPFRVYDAMQPLVDAVFVPTSTTAAVRFRLRRFGVSDGRLTARLTFAQGTAAVERALQIEVHGVEVPPVGKDSFRYTNWMNYDSMASCHGLKPWSPEHREMIRRYVRLAVYGRQNMAIVPLFGEDRKVEDFVRLLEEEGVWYLEGGHLAGFSTRKWGAPAFVPRGSTNLTTSAAGAAALAKKATRVAGIVRRNRWEDRWYQHVADEPSVHNVDEYRKTCGIVRKHMPGVRLVDAVETYDIAGTLDAVCPKNRYYEENRERFEALKTLATDEIWCYTCMFPGGVWLNRLLDHELLRPVLLPWGCARFALDGYLHWGYNQFTPANDPLRTGVSRDEHMSSKLPPGDRNVVYAGPDGPWPSVRLEAMRQGFEDLELLRLLAKRDRTAADGIVRRLVRGFGDYETDVKAYWRARRSLLEALAK